MATTRLIKGLLAYILLATTPAFAQTPPHQLTTATTIPIPTLSCIYVDQGPATDTKLCPSGSPVGPAWATAFGFGPLATSTSISSALDTITATPGSLLYRGGSAWLGETLASGMPILAGGAGPPTVGSLSGNTTVMVTQGSGTKTNGHMLVYDTNGNAIDGGQPPSGTSSISGLTSGQVTVAASPSTIGSSLPLSGTTGGAQVVSSTTAAKTSGHLATWDANGNAVDGGPVPSGGGGADTVTGALTAHSGGGQASATALPSQFNVVTTVAAAGDSVVLPTSPTAGSHVIVRNSGANPLAVFPAGTGIINNQSASTSINVVANTSAYFEAQTTTQWFTVP